MLQALKDQACHFQYLIKNDKMLQKAMHEFLETTQQQSINPKIFGISYIISPN